MGNRSDKSVKSDSSVKSIPQLVHDENDMIIDINDLKSPPSYNLFEIHRNKKNIID